MILRARVKPELPLLTDIDFHPRPRLKSRRPMWSNLPDESPTMQHLWRTRWQIVDVPNKSLITDPTIQLPGIDLPRGQWSLLNRFRSDAGPCRNSMHRLATLRLRCTPNNEAYCERVPVDLLRRRHFRITPSTRGGLQLAAETKFEIVKANDNNNNNNQYWIL